MHISAGYENGDGHPSGREDADDGAARSRGEGGGRGGASHQKKNDINIYIISLFGGAEIVAI